MSITAERKAELIKEYAIKEGDTGSADVQIAVLTERIVNLTDHFKTNKKDNHSRRGLLAMVATRRKLLDYVKGKDEARYTKLIAELGIRRYGDPKQARRAIGPRRAFRMNIKTTKKYNLRRRINKAHK